MFDFGKLVHQCFLGLPGKFDTLRQRASCGKRHLHGKVTFIECGDELRTQTGEEKQRSGQQCEGRTNGRPDMV